MKEYSLIGKKIPRVDGKVKATGSLKYMTDLKMPDMLHGKALRSEYEHALIMGIDTRQAEKAEGVACVLTAKDIPGFNGHGHLLQDQPFLCGDKVRYLGDPVAVVFADTVEQAEAATKLIKVDYEPLTSVIDPEEAMKESAPKVHPDGNILTHSEAEVGDVEEAFKDAFLVEENDYTTTYQEHSYIETEGGVGVTEEDGSITIYCPAQESYHDRTMLSKMLDWPEEKITVVSTPIGGAFGGKHDIVVQGLLALGTYVTKRNVKVHISREESFACSVKRQPFRIHMRTAVDKNGKLMAQDTKAICDTGAYATFGPVVTNFGILNSGGVYQIPNARMEGYTIYTNNPLTAEFRGFGNNQVHYALESQMDIIAEKLGMDPFELRKKNSIQPDGKYCWGNKLHNGVGVDQVIETAQETKLWKEMEEFKNGANQPWLKRGIGVALCQQPMGLPKGYNDNSIATIELNEKGEFNAYFSAEDMGQGSLTTMAILGAETLGISMERINVCDGDTSKCPNSGGSVASRQTFVTGTAVKMAAEALKERIMEAAADKLSVPIDQISFDGDTFRADKSSVPIEAIAKMLCAKGETSVTKQYHLVETDLDFNPPLFYISSYQAQIVGIEVNTLTGKTDVLVTEAIPDAGRVINKLGYEGQVEGGTVMGMGYAIMENYKYGEPANTTRNFQTYMLPTTCDLPEIRVTPVEVLEREGPYGSKGFGELTAVAITPAITNAIYDAVGVRVRELPASPERLYKMMQELK